MIDWEYIGSRTIEILAEAALSSGIILGFFCCFLFLALILQLVTLSLRRRWYEILGERSWIALAAPGTVVHEAGHALFCLIFRHKILEMKLFSPESDGTLGMVRHSWDPESFYQRAGNFFIGTGPIITGVLVISCCTAWLLPDVWNELEMRNFYTFSDFCAALISMICRLIRGLLAPEIWQRWQTWLWLVITLLIGAHVTLSRADLKNAAAGFQLIPAAVFIFNLAVVWYRNPAELLLRYGGGHLLYALALLSFIVLILEAAVIMLNLPVFQRGAPGKTASR